MSWSKQKRALLKGRIELTCAEASAFLDAEAAEIKAHDAQNQPVLDSLGQMVLAPITSIERYRRTLLFTQLNDTPAQIRAQDLRAQVARAKAQLVVAAKRRQRRHHASLGRLERQ